MATPYRCPECNALVKTAQPLPAGKKLRCPKCDAVFVPELDDDEPERVTAATSKSSSDKISPRARTPKNDRDDDEDNDRAPGRKSVSKYEREDEDAGRPRGGRSQPQKKGGRALLLIGILVGVAAVLLVLLLGVGGVAYWLMAGRNPAAGPKVVAGVAEKVEQPVAPQQPDNAVKQPIPAPVNPNPVNPNPAPVNPNPPPVKPDPVKPDPVKPNPPIVAPVVVDLPKEILDKTRRATALIRVDFGGGKGATGSGFLVTANGDTGYVITNYHVIALRDDEPPPAQKKGKFPGMPSIPRMPFFGKGKFGPGSGTQPKAKRNVTVVLDSGTAAAQSISAEVVAIDDEADLAALRITGVRNLPAALDVSQQAPVKETLPVYIFGFPMDKAADPANPTITIGQGSISGLRRDDNNDLTDVHINGELNPGNSGGPVIDAQGRLIGIAVATVPGKQIGFAVPAAELHQMFKGRVFAALVCQIRQQGTRVNLTGELWRLNRKSKVLGRDILQLQLADEPQKVGFAPNEYFALVRLTDPMHKVSAATIHFAVAPKGALKANGQGWGPLDGAQKFPLKIGDQDALAKFTLPAGAVPDETYAFQLSYVDSNGQTIYTEPHLLRLTFPKNLKSVTVKIGPIEDEPTRRYVEDTIPKLFAGVTVKTQRTQTGVSVEIDPVEDPKTIPPIIVLADVAAIEGRTITMTAKKIDLPVPNAAEVAQALEELKAPDAMRRTGAADRLAKAYVPLPDRRVEVAKALLAQVNDKDGWLRGAAFRALEIWSGPECVAGLLPVLDNNDWGTRAAATRIITKYKDPSAAPALAKLLPGLGERAAISAALKAIGSPAQKAVIPYLTHKDGFTASEACHILKEIGTAESIPALQAVLDSNPNFMVGPAAREALKSIQARK